MPRCLTRDHPECVVTAAAGRTRLAAGFLRTITPSAASRANTHLVRLDGLDEAEDPPENVDLDHATEIQGDGKTDHCGEGSCELDWERFNHGA